MMSEEKAVSVHWCTTTPTYFLLFFRDDSDTITGTTTKIPMLMRITPLRLHRFDDRVLLMISCLSTWEISV